MKKVAFLLIILFIVSGCEKEKDLYQAPEQPASEEQKDFSLFDRINVEANLPEGTRCLLFDSYPYVDGTMTGEPIMVATAPFNKNIRVAKDVKTLYMYVNGEVKEYPRADIQLQGDNSQTEPIVFTRGTRAEETAGDVKWVTLSNAFITAINAYYPEKVVNVFGDRLTVCTDLVAPKGIKSHKIHPDGSESTEYWESTKVWLTYVTDGGCNFPGTLWYYTYQVDEDGTILTSLNEIEQNKVLVYENATPANAKGKRIYLGEFEPGTRIGFKYLGNAKWNDKNYPKYTTPHYNGEAYPNRADNGSSNVTYNGETTTRTYKDYKDNNYTAGIIRTWDYDGKTYATLGMENRLPSESSWDGDFNDMLFLVEADPLFVETILPPPFIVPGFVKWQGYWLFEDNYPAEGDYDFNDLVVKYAITEPEGKPTIVDLQFMAKGADYNNSFGINNKIYYENLKGYENVYANEDKADQTIKQITMEKADEYIPMLNNGNAEFNLKTYNSHSSDFPHVLEIPASEDFEFLWCLESIRIDAAYPRYKEWVDSKCAQQTDWYKDTPVTGTVWNK